MRTYFASLLLIATLGVGGCSFHHGQTTSEAEEQTKVDADSAVRKAGKAAHEIARESEEAAKKAGREVKKAAQEAKEGWKEDAQAHPKPKN